MYCSRSPYQLDRFLTLIGISSIAIVVFYASIREGEPLAYCRQLKWSGVRTNHRASGCASVYKAVPGDPGTAKLFYNYSQEWSHGHRSFTDLTTRIRQLNIRFLLEIIRLIGSVPRCYIFVWLLLKLHGSSTTNLVIYTLFMDLHIDT